MQAVLGLLMGHQWRDVPFLCTAIPRKKKSNMKGRHMKLLTASIATLFLALCTHSASAATWYVDASRPDDSGDGSAWATAKHTIQAAIDGALSGDTIFVTNGVYAPITASKLITIRSMNGADVTMIDGGGTNRCADLSTQSYGVQVTLIGFTLKNGYLYSSDWLGGAGVSGGILNSCILSNNVCEASDSYGGFGGGAENAALNNCLLIENTSTTANGGGTYSCNLNNCTVVNNNGGGTHGGNLNNCIVWNNDEYDCYGGTLQNCCAKDWRFYIGNYNYGHEETANALHYSVGNNINVDPLFIDPSSNDFRLHMNSPCVNAGKNNLVVGLVDLNGSIRVQGYFADMGAYESSMSGYTIAVDIEGAGAVVARTQSVVIGENVTLIATEVERAFRGWYVDDELRSVELIWTLLNVQSNMTVKAVFDCLHVDSNRPDDSGDGLTWGTAKKSIQAAIDASVAIDTIYVADGVYSAIVATNHILNIKSLNGAANAIIDGDGIQRCANLHVEALRVYYPYTQTQLTGFTLANGVAVNEDNLYPSSFDKCGGGALYGILYDCILENNLAEGDGGGAYGSTLDSCFLIGNSAYLGGGGADCMFNNCMVISNTAFVGGGMARFCGAMNSKFLYNTAYIGGGAGTIGGSYNYGQEIPIVNCLFANNKAYTGGGIDGRIVILFNCTITDNAATFGGGVWIESAHDYPINGYAFNSIIWGNYATGAIDSYMVFLDHSCTGDDLLFHNNSIIADPLFVDADNGDYRLQDGSPCIDTGSYEIFFEHSSFCGEFNVSYLTKQDVIATLSDLSGDQRLQGTQIDMGAYEGGVDVPSNFPPYTETVDGIAYTYYILNGESTIGNGSTAAININTIGELNIPSTLGGYPVTTIDNRAFANCTHITSVTIPNSVLNLGANVFENCRNVTNINLSQSLTILRAGTFYNCASLRSIVLPDMIRKLTDNDTSTGLLYNPIDGEPIPGCFTACSALQSIHLSTNLQHIGTFSFRGCSSLPQITIPASVKTIGVGIFNNCQALTNVQYLGQAPTIASNPAWVSYNPITGESIGMYVGTPLNLITWVRFGSIGWDENILSMDLPLVWPQQGMEWQYQLGYNPFSGEFIDDWRTLYLNLTTGGLIDGGRAIRHYVGTPVNITLNGNGGSPNKATQSLNAVTFYGRLPTPTRNGHVFMGWFTAPLGGDEINENAIVPEIDINLYAHWAKGYTLTLNNAIAEDTFLVAGATVEVSASTELAHQEFQYWVVSPAGISLGDTFDLSCGVVRITMPATNVTLTAVFAEYPGEVQVEWVPNDPSKTVTNVQWSMDRRTWHDMNELPWLISGTYTFYFQSKDNQWFLPASQKITLNAEGEDSFYIAINCEFAPAFDGNTLDGATDPNSDQGQWNEESGQLDWTGLRVGLRAKLGPLPLQANATSVKLKSGKLPTGLKLLTIDNQVYLSGIPTKAGTYPAVLQAMEGRKTGALLPVVWTVQDLPTEYIGTFNGLYTATTNDITRHSTLTLTVAKTGKLTGSVSLGGKKYSLKADAFDAIDYDTEAMSVTNAAFICTSPKLTNAITLAVSANEFGLGVADVAALVDGANVYDGQAVRNGWSDKVKMEIRTNALTWAKGYYTLALYPEDNDLDIYGAGYITLTVDAKGAVKASGKLADGTAVSGSSVLLVKAADDVSAVIALSPSAYKGGEFYLNVRFIQDAQPRVETVETVNWVNTVTTTTSNGPFERKPEVKGGWYSQLTSLYSVYDTSYDPENPYKLELSADAITTAVSMQFNAKGTGVDALSKTNNPYNVKLTLTPKTGLFSGSFNETGVKTAYKLYGILTPYLVTDTDDTAGLGFYSIPVIAPKTQRSELFRLTTEAVEP